MALRIQQKFVNSIAKRFPWLPQQAVLPLALAVVAFPAVSVLSFSYGPMVSVQPEGSSLSGGASVVADAGASGGQSLKFGSAAGTCSTKPDATNTGTTGALTADGRSSLNTANEVIEDKTFPGDLTIYADGVELRNVHVNGSILINEANNVVIDHVSTIGIGISSSSNITVAYTHISAYEADSFHITSDGASYINNVTIEHSFVDRPTFEPGSLSHWDGVQIRGADYVNIYCNNFDAGAWQDPYNVLIYLEPANGGHNHIVIDNNWLNGGNFAIQAGRPNLPVSFSMTNNKLFDADFNFGLCHLGGGFTAENLSEVVQTGNTLDGAPLAQICQASDINP